MGGNGKEIIMEKPLFTFLMATLIFSQISISLELDEASIQRISDIYILALYDTDGQTIDEENNIWYDTLSWASRCDDPELINSSKRIIIPIVKIYESHQGILLACLLVLWDGGLGSANEFLKDLLIGFK